MKNKTLESQMHWGKKIKATDIEFNTPWYKPRGQCLICPEEGCI